MVSIILVSCVHADKRLVPACPVGSTELSFAVFIKLFGAIAFSSNEIERVAEASVLMKGLPGLRYIWTTCKLILSAGLMELILKLVTISS